MVVVAPQIDGVRLITIQIGLWLITIRVGLVVNFDTDWDGSQMYLRSDQRSREALSFTKSSTVHLQEFREGLTPLLFALILVQTA